jgi:hypothetical protein
MGPKSDMLDMIPQSYYITETYHRNQYPYRLLEAGHRDPDLQSFPLAPSCHAVEQFRDLVDLTEMP